MKPEHLSKTHSSQKLATLLLRIDTAMHSENAQSTQLFLYCSGGERSVKVFVQHWK